MRTELMILHTTRCEKEEFGNSESPGKLAKIKKKMNRWRRINTRKKKKSDTEKYTHFIIDEVNSLRIALKNREMGYSRVAKGKSVF